MKKFFCLFLSMILLFPLASCDLGKPTPEEIVSEYCEKMKNYDFQSPDGSQTASSAEDMLTPLTPVYKDYASQITYTVHEAIVSDKTASVMVDFTYPDASNVSAAALDNLTVQLLDILEGSEDPNVFENAMISFLLDASKEVSPETETASVVFDLEKSDEGWSILEIPPEIFDISTANLTSAFRDLNSSALYEEALERRPAQDVPFGSSGELTDFKISVSGCTEQTELKATSFRTLTATPGSKLVVISLTVENLGKTSGAPDFFGAELIDSQERHYSVAMDHLSDTIMARAFAPNIPETGSLLFAVPEDSEGYYVRLTDAATGKKLNLFAK